MNFSDQYDFDILDAIPFVKKIFIVCVHTCHGIPVEARGLA